MNIINKFKEISNGYKNYLIVTDPVVEKEAKRRGKICSECPFSKWGLHSGFMKDRKIKEIEGMYCSDCGCPLSPAVRSESYQCPKNKW